MKRLSKIKRSISLLLTGVMLILMSVSGTVFAEGETEVENLFDANNVYEFTDTANYKSASEGTTLTEDEKDVVLLHNGTVTYEIPAVPESGMYMVNVATATVQDATKYYTITGTVGDVSWSGNTRCLTASSKNIGSFYLEEGVPTEITLSLSITDEAKSMTFTSIKVSKRENIAVSSTENTIIPAMSYTNRAFRTGTSDDENSTWGANTTGDEPNWNKGKATISSSSHYGIYNINAEAGLYDVYVLKSGTADNTMNLEVDGNVLTKSYKNAESPVLFAATGDYNIKAYTKIATIALLEGSHELKFKNVSGSGYFIAIKFVPKAAKEVSPTIGEKTEVSFGVDYLKGESFFNNVQAKVQNMIGTGYTVDYYDDVQFDRENSKVAQMTGSSHYGTYAIDVKETGTYDLSFVAGRYTGNYNIYVDDVLVKSGANAQLNNEDKTTTSTGTYANHAFAAEDYICSLFLTEGFHKIKIKYGSVSGMHYVWFLERSAQNLSTDETNVIYITSSDNYHATNSSGTKEFVTGDMSAYVSPSEYDTYAINGYATFRKGYYFDYSVNSPVAKDYKLYSIGGSTYQMTVKITDLANGAVIYEGKLNDTTSGYGTYTKTEMGRISLPAGVTTLRVSVTGGSAAWVSALELVPEADPTVTLLNGDGDTIDSVCEGTMNLIVDLNGYNKDTVYFAIYEEANGVKSLYKICKATITDGVADGTIEGIVKTEGKTYSAKVFVWDEATIFGYAYSF